MKWLRSSWFPLLLGLIIIIVILNAILSNPGPKQKNKPTYTYSETEEWNAPDTSDIPFTEEGYLIQYGRELIANTAVYFGPKGIVAAKSNGMNCQNCHINNGTQLYGNTFSAVASTYPRKRERSGKVETIEFRINDCMERSLNGQKIDENSREIKAMVAYLKWVGQGIPKEIKPAGAAVEELPFLNRAASPVKGKEIYVVKCQRCHGTDGEGVPAPDTTHYIYPPLWGPNSFNVSAGLYRISRMAGFIKNNMPFGASWKEPQVSNEEAWDLAAFIISQPRPEKKFAEDWPDIRKKPIDHPFGPFADPFSEEQHKYGPFGPIKQYRDEQQKQTTKNKSLP